MNNITIAGVLGRDAEISNTPNGDSILKFSVADGQGKDKPTLWWACNLWGRRAESLAPYMLKGQAVTVSGTVSERSWTDKSGQERKSMDVRVADVMLQGSRRDAEEAPKPARAPAPSPAPQPALLDDDVPF